MDQLYNYTITNFNPTAGTLEIFIEALQDFISIDAPIENGEYLTGEHLDQYIRGFIPIHSILRKQQLQQGIKNIDALRQFINSKSTEDNLAKTIRQRRHQALLECDWVMLPDAGFTETQIATFKKYRQALRDIPQQPGFPFNVEWPSCDGEWVNHPGIKKDDELDN